ncbi:MAG: class I SAM-dependent methyltransferase [Acidimicrobiia bacterium]
MASPRTRFDAQAPGFDRRTGVGGAAPAIADAVVAAASLGRDATLLEIGPGTGEIGVHLAALVARYAGLELSQPMLDEFAARPPDRARALLVRADAARSWPVRPASAQAVFASRAAHLLDVAHAAAEILRVAAPGAAVLLGRVEREPGGLRQRLRSRRRALIAVRGVDPGRGRDRGPELLSALAGAAPVGPHPVASWTVRTDAAAVLDAWERTGTVGGLALPPDLAAAVNRELRAWAHAELPRSAQETETYVLEGARLP